MARHKGGVYTCACGRKSPPSLYAVAQLAMGYDLVHPCDCGRRNCVYPGGRVELDKLPAKPKGRK